MGGKRRRQMAARRKAQNADPRWVQVVRQSAHGSDGAGGVLQHGRVARVRPQPIMQYKCRDAQRVQPFSDIFALVIRQHPITAAGADDDGCPGLLPLRRVIACQRRRRDIFGESRIFRPSG